MNIKRYVHNRISTERTKGKERKFGKPKLAMKRVYDVQFIHRLEYKQNDYWHVRERDNGFTFVSIFP